MTDFESTLNAPQAYWGPTGPTPFEEQIQALNIGPGSPYYETLMGTTPPVGVDYTPPLPTGLDSEFLMYGNAREPLVVEHMSPGEVQVFKKLPDGPSTSGDGSGSGA